MAKGKDARARVRVVLECTSWVRNGNGNGINNKNKKKESSGIYRYITQKNRHNTSSYQIILNNNICFFIHGGKV